MAEPDTPSIWGHHELGLGFRGSGFGNLGFRVSGNIYLWGGTLEPETLFTLPPIGMEPNFDPCREDSLYIQSAFRFHVSSAQGDPMYSRHINHTNAS